MNINHLLQLRGSGIRIGVATCLLMGSWFFLNNPLLALDRNPLAIMSIVIAYVILFGVNRLSLIPLIIAGGYAISSLAFKEENITGVTVALFALFTIDFIRNRIPVKKNLQ